MKKILVVDDDPTTRHLVAHQLRRAGFSVSEAGDGEKALERVRREAFDLVLLDVWMPGLDPRGRRELGALLGGLPATLVVASHDLEFVAALCPRAIVLDGGAVVADGGAREIVGDRALLARHGLA